MTPTTVLCHIHKLGQTHFFILLKPHPTPAFLGLQAYDKLGLSKQKRITHYEGSAMARKLTPCQMLLVGETEQLILK